MRCNVTIGIPLYNSCDFIFQTMQSVLEQTDPNIEVLVVDDCSDDGSLDIIRELQENHPMGERIRVLRQPSNMGVSAARNRIIDEASGNYLYFLDSDDLMIGKDTISMMVSHAQRIDADAVFGSYQKLWLNGCQKEKYQYEQHDFIEEDSFAQFAFRKYGGIQASACNYLMKIELIKSANIRFVDADYYEDMVFTFDVAICVKNVVVLPDITYLYQFHDESLSHSQYRDVIPKREIERTINGFDYLKRHYSQLINKSYVSSWMYNILKTDFFILCNILKDSKKVVPQFKLREMKSIMYCPLSLNKIVYGDFKIWNLFFYSISHLPAFVGIPIIWATEKLKRI